MSCLQNDISQIKQTIKQDVALQKVASNSSLSHSPVRTNGYGTNNEIAEKEKLQTENTALKERMMQMEQSLNQIGNNQ